MYKVILKSTGEEVTRFYGSYRFGEWLASAGGNGVTHKISSHPSVDLRNVDFLDDNGDQIDAAYICYAYETVEALL